MYRIVKEPRISKKAAIAEIIQSLRRIFKAIQQYSEEVLKEFGVTGPQLWLIKMIQQEGGPSVSELSRKMYLHISTVSDIIGRLENKGYVVRKRETRDRRVVTVHLTDKGRRITSKAVEPTQRNLLYGLQKLSHREIMELYEALQKIVRLIEVEQIKIKVFSAKIMAKRL